jgi:methionine transaminase
MLHPSKLPAAGTTIFTVMSQLAAEHHAVNLGQGFPDFPADPRLIELLAEAARAGHNQYPHMTGIATLREAIAAKVQRLYGRPYDPTDEVTVVAGATQGIQTALSAIVHPGDEVILFEPCYDSYDPCVRFAGGTSIYVRLLHPHYKPDWEALAAAITPRTRAIVMNTPHNPTATIWDADDFARLEALIAHTDIVIVSDEVYEHIVFDGAQHLSIARHPRLAERAFLISSFGKTYHVTGWKTGYVCAPRELMREFRRHHQFVVFTVHSPTQHAFAQYMTENAQDVELAAFYQAKRDRFVGELSDSGWRALPSRGTYFVLLSYAGLSHEPERVLAERLVREYGIATIPLSAFYAGPVENQTLRLCFAKRDATLSAGVTRLRQAAKGLTEAMRSVPA